MENYVIIGGGGFLGAMLIMALQKNGVRNKCIVLDPNPKLASFGLEIDESLLVYEKASFENEHVLDRVLRNAVTVFHLAAIGHTGPFGSPLLADRVEEFNVGSTKRLIAKCQEHGVKRFIYSSSVAIAFVGKPIYNVSEEDPLPDRSEYIDHYSSTKAKADQFVLSSSSDNFKTSCLRFRAIYGPQDVSVAEKVVNMVSRGLFMIFISCHERESISNMSSGPNCGTAMFLADKALQKEDGPHGRAYYIHDGEEIGQYSVWSPLIRALGKTPPQHSIPYWMISLFVKISALFCYYILQCAPPMTQFELDILACDNTYSIERARNELNFVPEKGYFEETVQYYKKNRPKVDSPGTLFLNLIHSIFKTLVVVFYYFFGFY